MVGFRPEYDWTSAFEQHLIAGELQQISNLQSTVVFRPESDRTATVGLRSEYGRTATADFQFTEYG